MEKNHNGYELETRKGVRYDMKRTLMPVSYEYVFLPKGRKSYKAFDYKSKDPDARAVYANGDVLLVKKPLSKGDITVFNSIDDKKLNAAKKRTSLNKSALLLIGVALIVSALMKIISPLRLIFLIIDIVLVLMAGYNYYLSYLIAKFIKHHLIM